MWLAEFIPVAGKHSVNPSPLSPRTLLRTGPPSAAVIGNAVGTRGSGRFCCSGGVRRRFLSGHRPRAPALRFQGRSPSTAAAGWPPASAHAVNYAVSHVRGFRRHSHNICNSDKSGAGFQPAAAEFQAVQQSALRPEAHSKANLTLPQNQRHGIRAASTCTRISMDATR